MASNVFPHYTSGEAPIYLMFGCNTFMPTLFKLLPRKLRYIGDECCKIYLDDKRDFFMMAVFNLKIARDEYPPLTWDQDRTKFKVGNMVLLKNHAPTRTFDVKYKPSFRICEWIFDNAFDV